MKSTVGEAESMLLVNECKELEEEFETHYVDEIWSDNANAVCGGGREGSRYAGYIEKSGW